MPFSKIGVRPSFLGFYRSNGVLRHWKHVHNPLAKRPYELMGLEVQNCFTTKDEAFDPAFNLGDNEVYQASGLHPRKPQRDASGSSSSLCNAFLCVLCAFARGISFFSRPFVALTQVAKVSRQDGMIAPCSSVVAELAELRRTKHLIPLLILVTIKKSLEIDYPRSKTAGYSANFILT
jgi:hypothetical protein